MTQTNARNIVIMIRVWYTSRDRKLDNRRVGVLLKVSFEQNIPHKLFNEQMNVRQERNLAKH